MVRALLERQSCAASGAAGIRGTSLRWLGALAAAAFLALPLSSLAATEPSPTPRLKLPPPSTPPPPGRTPVHLTIRTLDKNGNEHYDHLTIHGNLNGDYKEFLRQYEAMNPHPPAPDHATPAPVKPLKGGATPIPGPFHSALQAPSPAERVTTGSVLAAAVSDRAAGELFRMAQGFFRQGQIPKGRQILGQIFRMYPHTRWAGEGHVAWGRQADVTGRWAEAVQQLADPSVQLCPPPRQIQAALTATDALVMLDDYKDARARAAHALQLAEKAPRYLAEVRDRVDILQVMGSPAPPLQVAGIIQEADKEGGAASDAISSKTATRSGAAKRGGNRAVPKKSGVQTASILPLPAGRVVWIHFFEPACKYCEKAYPREKPQADEAIDDGAAVIWIGVNPDASPIIPPNLDVFRSYLKEYPRSGTVAVDFDHSATFHAYKGTGSPWTVLVDRKGIVRFAGVYNEAKVRDKLTQLLGEGDVGAPQISSGKK